MDRYVEVTGEARAQETATEYYARLEVEVRAAPKGGAGATARDLRNTVVRTLREAGLRDDELVEGGEGMSRSWWWRKKHDREASHTIHVKCVDYVRMVRALAALEPLAGDKRTNIDVHMPPPKFEGTPEARVRARVEALRDARAKAEVLAAEAGVKIMGVLRIEELDGRSRRGDYDSHGVLYSRVAEADFEHDELSAPTREVTYTYRMFFAIA